jgi:hypothetical protein
VFSEGEKEKFAVLFFPSKNPSASNKKVQQKEKNINRVLYVVVYYTKSGSSSFLCCTGAQPNMSYMICQAQTKMTQSSGQPPPAPTHLRRRRRKT